MQSILVFVALQCICMIAFGAEGENLRLAAGQNSEITLQDVRGELASISPDAAERIRSSERAIENMAVDLLTRKIIAEKAEQEFLSSDALIERRIHLARERVLYEAYLERRESAQISEQMLEAAAREEYLAFPERYTREEVRARHILLPRGESCSCEGKVRAEEILIRLKEGESFEALARELSIDKGSAVRGGDLGVFPRGKMVPAFDAAVFALKKPGELSDVVETQFGYHIIRLDEMRPPMIQPFSEVKASLIEAARTRLRGNVRREIIGPIREGLASSVDRALVNKVVNNPDLIRP